MREEHSSTRRRWALWLLILPCVCNLAPATDVHGEVADGTGPPPTEVTVAIDVAAPIDAAFALFEPSHRTSWDHDWDIQIVTPAGTVDAAQGTTFKRPVEPETIWRIVELDRQRHRLVLTYTKPKLYDMTIQILCTASSPTATTVEVTYIARGKTDHVAEILAHRLEHQIVDLLRGEEGWESKLAYYLQHGTRMAVFSPLTIERQYVIELDAAPDRVFALLDPAGGNHWTRSTPDYLFGSEESPSSAMWRAGDGWYVVAHHDDESRTMTTILSIPGTEFMIENIRCAARPQGGTTMTVIWRVAGVSPAGNDAVQGFFDTKWDRRMQRIEETYTQLLAQHAP